MPFSGGVFTRIRRWVGEANTSAIEFDADGDDVATALSNCILRDGTGAPRSDIPWGSKKLTSLAAGVADADAVNLAQVRSLIPSLNLLRNSGFQTNTRGLSGTITPAPYGHDGWTSAGGSYSVATTGISGVATVLSGSLYQTIEPELIAGGTYTASNAGTAPIRVWQGGSSSGSFVAGPVTTGTLTANLKTSVDFGPGTIIQPQFQIGSKATPWFQPLIGEEAVRNLRLLQMIGFRASVPMPVNGSYQVPFFFPQMRTQPLLFSVTWAGLSNNSGTPSVLMFGPTSGSVTFPGTGSPSVGTFSAVNMLLSCENF